MAKDPAFLFYPGDWLGGTMHLDFECKGAYMELLMMQFQRGHMTIDMIRHVLGHKFDHIWPSVKDKFKTDGNFFWNERLLVEKEKRIKYTDSRKKNKEGKNQHSKKLGHMTSHMENVNENRNTDLNTLKEYDNWTQLICDGNDQHFESMFMKETIPPGDHIQFWIMDHRDLLNRYPKMRPPNQDAFRKSCIKHIRENYKKPINGNGNGKPKFDAQATLDRLNSYGK